MNIQNAKLYNGSMTYLKLQTIKITNFRGIKSFAHDLHGESMIIEGKNGIGKSSILNAITYVFSGEVISGRTNNLLQLGGNSFEIIADFTFGEAKHQLKAVQSTSEKLYFFIDNTRFESKARYLQMLAKLIHVRDANEIIDIIHPINIEESIGNRKKDSTKQLRDSFIRAINFREKIFDNDEYLKLKMEIDRKSETTKLLTREYKNEKEYAVRFKESNQITDETNDDDSTHQYRNDLENMEERFNNREALKNRLLSINSKITELQLRIDPKNFGAVQKPFRRWTIKNILLLIITFGFYWKIIRSKEKQNENTRVTVQKISRDELAKLETERNKLLKELDKTSSDGNIDIESIRNKLREMDSQNSMLANNKEKWRQLMGDLKESEEQISQLNQEVTNLKAQKSQWDAKLEKVIATIFPKQWKVLLFSDDDDEIFDVTHQNISFENLNRGEQIRIVSEISNVLAGDYKIEAFNVIDHFESIVNFQTKNQIIAARVTNAEKLIVKKS